MRGVENKFKKRRKKFKKGVDKKRKGMYNTSSRLTRAPLTTGRQRILENDTE